MDRKRRRASNDKQTNSNNGSYHIRTTHSEDEHKLFENEISISNSNTSKDEEDSSMITTTQNNFQSLRRKLFVGNPMN